MEQLTKLASHADNFLQELRYTIMSDLRFSGSRMDVTAGTKLLCNEYVEDRLIRSGLNLKQRKITRVLDPIVEVKGSAPPGSKGVDSAKPPRVKKANEHDSGSERNKKLMSDISRVLLYVGEMLELRHTSVYTDVLAQLSISTLTEATLRKAVLSVGKDLFEHGVTWAKIVSLFAFAGGMAVDCVLNGSTFFVPKVKQLTVDFIDEHLTDWIIRHGGWLGLFQHFTIGRPQDHTRLVWTVSIATLFVSFLIMTIVSLIY